MTAVHSREAAALPPTGPAPHPGMPVSATVRAFGALVARDLTVLRRQPLDFFARSVVQPLVPLFALGYVTPRIAAGASGTSAGSTFAADQATTLLAGMLAMVVLFQGITAVAMPLVQEFGVTREIDGPGPLPVPVSWWPAPRSPWGAARTVSPRPWCSPSPSSSRRNAPSCTSIGRCC
ncbi:hypothetical protein ACU686_08480 [Yinghuangia aomiensis]